MSQEMINDVVEQFEEGFAKMKGKKVTSTTTDEVVEILKKILNKHLVDVKTKGKGKGSG